MHDALNVVGMVVVVGGILVLVRPGSQGPAFVSAISRGFTGVMSVVTGSATPPGYVQTGQAGAK